MIDGATITATLSRHARARPDRVAMICDGHAITWRELDRAVNRIAAHFAKVVPAGRGVALHLPNGPALALLFLAIARAGREAQILDPNWPIETTRLAIGELSPGLVISHDPALAADGGALILTDPHGPFETVAETIGASVVFEAMPEPDPLASFYVGFTSGSTGVPKGYRRHHLSGRELSRRRSGVRYRR